MAHPGEPHSPDNWQDHVRAVGRCRQVPGNIGAAEQQDLAVESSETLPGTDRLCALWPPLRDFHPVSGLRAPGTGTWPTHAIGGEKTQDRQRRRGDSREDGFKQIEDSRHGLEAVSEYFAYTLHQRGIVQTYLKRKCALHLHLSGLPLQGQWGSEEPTADLCIFYQRFHAAIASDHHKAVRELRELESAGYPLNLVPGRVYRPMLVDVVEVRESFEHPRKDDEAGVGGPPN